MEDLERSRRSRLYRQPSISSDMLRSVLKQQREASSSSSSDEETVSIQQATTTGPKFISITPEPSHSNEVEDVFDIYSPRNESNSVPAQMHKHQTIRNLHGSRQLLKLPSVSSCNDAQHMQGLARLIGEPITVLETDGKTFVSNDESFSRKKSVRKKRLSPLDLKVAQVLQT